MHRQIKLISLLCCTLLSGCLSHTVYNNIKEDYNHPPLGPSQENRWLVIDGVIPPEVKITIVTNYESSKGCKRNNGQVATLYELVYPESGKYSIRVPLDGGTRCGWVLYQIDISSKLKDPNLYNSRIPVVGKYAPMTSGSAIQSFLFRPTTDNNATVEVSKTPLYYPYASLFEVAKGYAENNSESVLWLNPINITKSSSSDARTTTSNFYYQFLPPPTPLGVIHFSPVVDHDYLVYGYPEGSQLKGNYIYRENYPNGDVTENKPLRDYRYYEITPKKKEPWKPIIPD